MLRILCACLATLTLTACTSGGARDIRATFAELPGATVTAQKRNVAIVDFDDLPGRPILLVNGVITTGTEAAFLELLPEALERNSSGKPLPLLLNSRGGQVVPALRMGLVARQAGVATVVADTLCVSSCALLWLGGERRYARGEARIGFHAPHWAVIGTRSTEADQLVRRYVEALGFDEQLAEVTLAADANEIVWLTPDLAAALDLGVNVPLP